MRRKSVYVSKYDPKLKKQKRRAESKKKRVPKGLEYEYAPHSHPDRPHFCDACDIPQ